MTSYKNSIWSLSSPNLQNSDPVCCLLNIIYIKIEPTVGIFIINFNFIQRMEDVDDSLNRLFEREWKVDRDINILSKFWFFGILLRSLMKRERLQWRMGKFLKCLSPNLPQSFSASYRAPKRLLMYSDNQLLTLSIFNQEYLFWRVDIKYL